MWRRVSLVILISSVAIFGALYVIYRLVDPLPPRHLIIAASTAGSGYDNIAKRYALLLARHGVELEIRHSAGAVEDLNLLREPASGVQAALTTFGVTQPADMDTLYSLGGIFDAAIFIFYRDAEPITLFAQLRGKRIGMGVPGTALRSLMLDVLKATDALDASTQLISLDYAASIDALISGGVDVAIVPAMENAERTIAAPGIRLMSVAQAEAIAKTVPGLKHVVLWRGLIDLSHDIPNSDVDLLALRSSARSFTPRCNICCWKPCVRSTRHQARSIASVNSQPSSPTICPYPQRRKRSTARVHSFGSDTRPFGSVHSSAGSCSLSFRCSRR
jgi:hypothetical protein